MSDATTCSATDDQHSWISDLFGLDPRSYSPAGSPALQQCTEPAPAPPAPPVCVEAEPPPEPQVCVEPDPTAEAPESEQPAPAPEPVQAPPETPKTAAGPSYQTPDTLYRAGYAVGLKGGFPICPAGGDADGEAAYESGYAAGKQAAQDRKQPPPDELKPTPPGQELMHRMITVLSDDEVGTVQKEFVGTKDELDRIEDEATRQIQQHWLNNLPGEGPV